MTFAVRFSPAAEEDLDRLLDYLVDRAEALEDLDNAQAAINALRTAAVVQLSTTPFTFRKTGMNSKRRELIVPFGASGYVALYEIAGPLSVVVLAVRRQLEEDCH